MFFCIPTVIKTQNKNIEYRILQDTPINEFHINFIEYVMIIKLKINIKESGMQKSIKKKKFTNQLKSKDKYFITAIEFTAKLAKT